MRSLGSLLKQEISYLVSAKSKLLLIGFISVFSLLFILVYDPFHLSDWSKGHYLDFILIGASVLLLSQFVLRPIIGLGKLTLITLIFWSLFEILILTCIFYFLYGRETSTITEKIYEFWDTLFQVGLVIIVPYVLFVWYSHMKFRFSKFEHIQANTEGSDTNDAKKLLVFHGDREKVIFAVKFSQLLYVKSAGNYLELYFRKGSETERQLVRASVKELEDKIMGTNIIKIHRSFLINMSHISSFKRTRKGYTILVHHAPDTFLPVSSGYKNVFEEALEKIVSH